MVIETINDRQRGKSERKVCAIEYKQLILLLHQILLCFNIITHTEDTLSTWEGSLTIRNQALLTVIELWGGFLDNIMKINLFSLFIEHA